MKLSKAILRKLTGEQKKELELFEMYLFEEERAKNTIISYIYGVASFFLFGGELEKVNLVRFKKYLTDKYEPKTVNLRLAGLNNYLIFKGREDLKIKMLKMTRSPFTDGVISEDEYQQLLAVAKIRNKKVYFIIRFLATTGARISEAIRVTKQDFMRGYAEMHTKGKHRRINIPRSFIDESNEFFSDLEDKDFLFLNKYEKQLSTRGIANLLKDIAVKAGVRREVVHPHNFRHFFAIQFLKHNNNLALLADLLGHSSVDMTALYARMSQGQQREALNDAVVW